MSTFFPSKLKLRLSTALKSNNNKKKRKMISKLFPKCWFVISSSSLWPHRFGRLFYSFNCIIHKSWFYYSYYNLSIHNSCVRLTHTRVLRLLQKVEDTVEKLEVELAALLDGIDPPEWGPLLDDTGKMSVDVLEDPGQRGQSWVWPVCVHMCCVCLSDICFLKEAAIFCCSAVTSCFFSALFLSPYTPLLHNALHCLHPGEHVHFLSELAAVHLEGAPSSMNRSE